MATHSSILAWKIPQTEEPGRLQTIGRKESDTTEVIEHSTAQNLLFSGSVMLTLCDPMDCSMPGFPVLHHLLEVPQTHVH